MLVNMKKALLGVFKEEDGATALEYAILVVLIAIAMSVGAALFGNALLSMFNQTGNTVDTLGPGAIGG
ncbi:MAG: Flp family type IVb pilin [Blastopirellula sp.]|nr:MAG: Flp family type IVb pilin [Blastopirellula sp.]